MCVGTGLTSVCQLLCVIGHRKLRSSFLSVVFIDAEELCEWIAPKLDADIKPVKLLKTKKLVKKNINLCDIAFIFLPVFWHAVFAFIYILSSSVCVKMPIFNLKYMDS